ncbi:MAG: hypothetical protein RBS34_17180, partial [Desulfofustis sp.]|nr:hypothetical protein [Desulfofustis sp.]
AGTQLTPGQKQTKQDERGTDQSSDPYYRIHHRFICTDFVGGVCSELPVAVRPDRYGSEPKVRT